jgi:hypothetical protein
MTRLEERRQQSDMLQLFKILNAHNNVQADHSFRLTANSENRTRQATGVLIYFKGM